MVYLINSFMDGSISIWMAPWHLPIQVRCNCDWPVLLFHFIFLPNCTQLSPLSEFLTRLPLVFRPFLSGQYRLKIYGAVQWKDGRNYPCATKERKKERKNFIFQI